MGPLDFGQALTVALIWGLNFIVIKTAVTEIPPLALTTLRFIFAAALVAPFFRPTRKQIPFILGLALIMGFGHFSLLFVGLRGADAATVALILQLGAPFSSILAAVFFADRLGWKRSLGMAFAFTGAALLAGEPQGGTLLAIIATLVSAFCWAWANILIKQIQDIHPLTIIGWMSLLAVPIVAAMSAFLESGQIDAIQNASWKAWSALTYIVVGSSIIAYTLWYKLLVKLSVNQVVPFTLIAPVIGVAAGVMILGEAFTIYKLVGGALTLLGVGIIQFRQAAKASADANQS